MASTGSLRSLLLRRETPRTAMWLFPRRNGFRPRLARLTPRSPGSRTYASSSTSSSKKGAVLSKPDKFRPPSHPSRKVMKGNKSAPPPRNYPGPKPTAEEAEAQKTRWYPHTFPPEGSVMYRFLTNKFIHFLIPMSVLFGLATFTFSQNFKQKSPVAHLLPPWSGLIYHPIDTIGQFFHVIRMDAQHNTLQSKESRRRKVDDVEKRRAYRIAHGLEEPAAETQKDAEGSSVDPAAAAEEGAGDGKRKKPKWFGIW